MSQKQPALSSLHLTEATNQFGHIGQNNLSVGDTDTGKKVFNTLKVQSIQMPVVKADEDEEYIDEMEQLQKKLAALKRQKEKERLAQLQAQRLRKQQEENRRQEQQRIAEQERQRRDDVRRQAEQERRRKDEEGYFGRRWDDLVDDWEHPEDIPANLGKDFEDTVDTLTKAEEDTGEFIRELPDRSRQIWQKLMILKWLFNMWLFAFPWCAVVFVVNVWNLYVNIFWNDYWAQGNVFLMANSAFLVMQTLVSIPLAFEIPPLLRWIKPLRLLSMTGAIVYNVLYLGSVFDFFYLADIEEDDLLEDQGWGDMFLGLVIFYNLVENFPITLINSGIIIKESILPWFQLVANTKAPDPRDRVQLGLLDLEDFALILFNLANPTYIWRIILKWILGWDPQDMIIENPQDEEHYYAGKAWSATKDEAKTLFHY